MLLLLLRCRAWIKDVLFLMVLRRTGVVLYKKWTLARESLLVLMGKSS